MTQPVSINTVLVFSALTGLLLGGLLIWGGLETDQPAFLIAGYLVAAATGTVFQIAMIAAGVRWGMAHAAYERAVEAKRPKAMWGKVSS